MAKNTERRRKKDKKRTDKKQVEKSFSKSSTRFTEAQKKSGKIQIFIVIALSLAAAMFIITNLDA